MKQTDGKCELTLFSSMLAKDIFIETPLQGAVTVTTSLISYPENVRK